MVWGFQTCGPNHVMVVSGCCYSPPALVPGGRIFVWPLIQRVDLLNLNIMTLRIESPRVYTMLGVPVTITGIAQVKIQSKNMDMLLTACEQFLTKSEQEIHDIALATMEGHQRAIMGSMTVEEIYQNRKKFAQQVFETASADLVNFGMSVISYTIKDLDDDKGYLLSLATPRTAQVKRDARIGEAEHSAEARIKEALAEEERMAAKYLNDTEIARAHRDFELKKAAYDVEVKTKQAEAELAFELQAAIVKQKIKEEELQIEVISRTKEIEVQEQEMARREQELESNVRRPAEAEKYKMERLAEAHRARILLEAEAEAEAIRLKGEAEAYAVEKKAIAEAEQMQKKADAYKDYKEVAKIDMVLEVVPKVTAEIAAPLSQTKKVIMISTGSGGVGAAKLAGEVCNIVARVPQLIKNITGVDVRVCAGHRNSSSPPPAISS